MVSVGCSIVGATIITPSERSERLYRSARPNVYPFLPDHLKDGESQDPRPFFRPQLRLDFYLFDIHSRILFFFKEMHGLIISDETVVNAEESKERAGTYR